MTRPQTHSKFSARLLRPKSSSGDPWAFVIVPKPASAKLPRRGRTTVSASLNGHRFMVLLEPDGRKGHWLRIDQGVLDKTGARIGDTAEFEIESVAEPEPEVPVDLAEALAADPASRATWDAASTVARLDWVHWVTSAKQARTRSKRIRDACEMLAQGKRRVCCFDPSGYYSKAFSAPEAEDHLPGPRD